MTDEPLQPVTPPGYTDAIAEMHFRQWEKMMAWTRRTNEGWRQDQYGTIQFPVEKKSIDECPFESLLAMCRVLGLKYTVKEHDHELGLAGRWCATIETGDGWPGDFFGGLQPKHRGGRSYGCVGAKSPLDALRGAFYEMFRGLRRSCEHWRLIVRQQHPDWFEDQPPDRGPVLEMFDVLRDEGWRGAPDNPRQSPQTGSGRSPE
jgi:hypothetical protein